MDKPKESPAAVLQRHLEKIDACIEARLWALKHSPEQAWLECPRADWLLWWAARTGTDPKRIAQITCTCACIALQYPTTQKELLLEAIETAERLVNEPTEQRRLAAQTMLTRVKGVTRTTARKASSGDFWGVENTIPVNLYRAADIEMLDVANYVIQTVLEATRKGKNLVYHPLGYKASQTVNAVCLVAWANAGGDDAGIAARDSVHLKMCRMIRERLACPSYSRWR